MTDRKADPTDPEMLAALREQLPPGEDLLSLDRFIRCALYHPSVGYYQRKRERVGRRDDTDFYTASSLGPVFARLVVAASVRLLDDDPGQYSFVELGPESETGILGRVPDHPFRDSILVRPGESFNIPSRSVVFSNEVFDAQPFRRLVWNGQEWRESGVRIRENGLEWDFLPSVENLPPLPRDLPAGYTVDWPEEAHGLMKDLCFRPWQGLFLAFDYGLDRATVLAERPEGTGRTYAGHSMGSDLLARPGETDITCHVIWDELEAIARKQGFEEPVLEHQESFFMHHAAEAIQSILAGEPDGFSPRKQTLMELLHPANMGRKFQVLRARRREI